MPAVKINYPIFTLEKQQLFSSGTVITEEILEELIAGNTSAPYRDFCLLDHGSVKNDLLTFFKFPAYRIVFGDEERINSLINLMEKVRLIPPLLESLDYFRERDPYTYRHILMVMALSSVLAYDLVAYPQDRIQEVISGPSHDLGKICVPLEVLKKTTALTQNERNMLEHHTLAGYVLLSYYLKDPNAFAAQVARDHHERRDGSGYPAGIQLKDHMIEIIAACDIFDALISPRPYRPTSYDNRTALEEMIAMAEKGALGWDVVKVLVAYNRKSRPDYREMTLSEEKRGSPPEGSTYGVILRDDAD